MRRTISFIMAMLMLISAISFTACSNVDATKDLEKIKEDGVLKVGMECNYAPFNWTQATKSETSSGVPKFAVGMLHHFLQ